MRALFARFSTQSEFLTQGMVRNEPPTHLYSTLNRPPFHTRRDGAIGFWFGFFWPDVQSKMRPQFARFATRSEFLI